jgi:hypothetical protein
MYRPRKNEYTPTKLSLYPQKRIKISNKIKRKDSSMLDDFKKPINLNLTKNSKKYLHQDLSYSTEETNYPKEHKIIKSKFLNSKLISRKTKIKQQ